MYETKELYIFEVSLLSKWKPTTRCFVDDVMQQTVTVRTEL